MIKVSEAMKKGTGGKPGVFGDSPGWTTSVKFTINKGAREVRPIFKNFNLWRQTHYYLGKKIHQRLADRMEQEASHSMHSMPRRWGSRSARRCSISPRRLEA
jgi:hypothetical protein